MAIFVVDSNFFIQAHRATYPLDIATGFWNKVAALAQAGTMVSIDKVRNELYGHNDNLEHWCLEHLPANFFKSTTEVMGQYAQVSAWAASRRQHYSQAALQEFLDADEADAFLVAYTLYDTNERVLVTHEVSQPERKVRIKIPDCCHPLGVKYVNTIGMFRELGETF